MRLMSKQAGVRPFSRKILAPVVAVCLALTIGSLAIMSGVGALPIASAAVLAVALVSLAATMLLCLAVDRMRHRMDVRHAENRRLLGKVAATLNQAGIETTNARLTGVERALQGLGKRLDASLRAVRQELKESSDQCFRQAEALDDMRALLCPRAPLPASRGWAASPDVMHLLIDHVWRHRPKLVVECGSGTSTVWLGYAVERVGGGRVVALEHDERYAEATRGLVRAHGLEEVVEVRIAPLERWQSGEQTLQWYAQEALEDLYGIGVVFVDGPPGSSAPIARYPALPRLLDRCVEDPLIVLDDAYRPDERTLSDRWLHEFPSLTRTEYQHEKGTHAFAVDLDRSPAPAGCR
jgi:predicted O-methyltransferase YrrM